MVIVGQHCMRHYFIQKKKKKKDVYQEDFLTQLYMCNLKARKAHFNLPGILNDLQKCFKCFAISTSSGIITRIHSQVAVLQMCDLICNLITLGYNWWLRWW